MGLLDDAIREHLDLKRRSGADPAEVERLEREALGPVRRGGFEHEEDVLNSDYPPDADYDLEGSEPAYAGEVADAAYPDDAEPDWVEPGEDQPLIHEAPGYEAFEDEPLTEVEPGALAEGPPVAESGARAEAPPSPEPRTEAPPAPPRHHEIAEAWDAHEALPGGGAPPPPQGEAAPPPPSPARPTPERSDHLAEPPDAFEEETAEYDVEADQDEEAGDDVLEETPDFLQDTPDHDRLWFEQRPPRDFDFGK